MVFLMGLFGQMSGNGLGYFNVGCLNKLLSKKLTRIQLSIYEALGFDSRWYPLVLSMRN